MMSIDNTYDADELRAFDTRVRKGLDGAQPKYVLEPKVDGVAVSLRYESGRLILAATRGDGARGDDITANAKTIRPIPLLLKDHKHLPRILEVRGEVYMTNEQFQKINKKREEAGEELFANPRNFTAGTLKQLDPKITASRNLKFVSHGLGEVDPPFKLDSYFEILDLLKHFGLPTNEQTNLVDNIDEAVEDIEAFAKIRGTLKYQTDGMVVKVDSLAQRDILGVTSKAPRWVIAYKYPAEQVQTVLNGVRWQVGKNGTLTPVADMEPVFVAGTTVKRASLHNIEQIQNLDIHIGDTVIIEKAGEIIPQVVLVVKPKRPKDAKPIKPPTKCPSCGAPVEKETDGPYIRCVNPACPAQLKERLRWFCARNQMNVERLGEALIDQLVEHGLLKTFADIYKLTKEQLMNLERMGDKRRRTSSIQSMPAAIADWIAFWPGSESVTSAIAWRTSWPSILVLSTPSPRRPPKNSPTSTRSAMSSPNPFTISFTANQERKQLPPFKPPASIRKWKNQKPMSNPCWAKQSSSPARWKNSIAKRWRT